MTFARPQVAALVSVLWVASCGGSQSPPPSSAPIVAPPAASESAATEPGASAPPPCSESNSAFCDLPGGARGRCLEDRCLTLDQCHDWCVSREEKNGTCENFAPDCDGSDPTCEETRRESIAQCSEARTILVKACVHDACIVDEEPKAGSTPSH